MSFAAQFRVTEVNGTSVTAEQTDQPAGISRGHVTYNVLDGDPPEIGTIVMVNGSYQPVQSDTGLAPNDPASELAGASNVAPQPQSVVPPEVHDVSTDPTRASADAPTVDPPPAQEVEASAPEGDEVLAGARPDAAGRPGDPEHPAGDRPGPAVVDPSRMTRDDLYDLAQDLDIPGRSKMDKDELAAAVAQRTQAPESDTERDQEAEAAASVDPNQPPPEDPDPG